MFPTDVFACGSVRAGDNGSVAWMGAPFPAETCRVGDVDGDGMADLIAFSATGEVWVAISTGASFGPRQRWSSGFGAPSIVATDDCHPGDACEVADASGDERADVVSFNSPPASPAVLVGEATPF